MKNLAVAKGIATASEGLVIVRYVNAVGSDDECALGNVLDLSVGRISHAVKEIEHTYGLYVVEKLKIEHYGATVKKIIKKDTSIVLVSENSAYEPMIFTKPEIESLPVTVIGKVVELRRKF